MTTKVPDFIPGRGRPDLEQLHEVLRQIDAGHSLDEIREHVEAYLIRRPDAIDDAPPLPRDEDGFINCSAEFGETFAVRVTYNTDPDGNWVDDDDYSNYTLHGGDMTQEEAEEWIEAYPDGDRDLKDIDIININRVRPA